ncbi:MAG: dTDP-glucose 4,6-dehydratase [Clostridia bacterium]|nr:dTDP-glucose 4,6-dehydratase [Clostridia bacterium]
MKIVVTGCAGFIGSHFAHYLLDNYPTDSVVGIDCITYAASEEALSALCQRDNFIFYKEDICNAEAIGSIFSAERPDVVVNFAAESHVDRSISDSSPFLRTNVIGTQVLLDASVRYNVSRFHQISTDEVYGDLPLDADIRFDEGSPLNPGSPYSASKAAADLLVLSYVRTYGLSASISRSANNYGIYQHTEKLIPMTVAKLRLGEPVPVYGDGQNMRDWLFVGDHCSAIDRIIRKGKCEIYNIGADNEWANIDLVKKIMSLSGYPDGEIAFVEDRKGHDRRYSVNCDKLRALGWYPRSVFDRELKTTVEWYKSK